VLESDTGPLMVYGQSLSLKRLYYHSLIVNHCMDIVSVAFLFSYNSNDVSFCLDLNVLD